MKRCIAIIAILVMLFAFSAPAYAVTLPSCLNGLNPSQSVSGGDLLSRLFGGALPFGNNNGCTNDICAGNGCTAGGCANNGCIDNGCTANDCANNACANNGCNQANGSSCNLFGSLFKNFPFLNPKCSPAATAKPIVTPKPTATAKPTATPKVTVKPTATPKPTSPQVTPTTPPSSNNKLEAYAAEVVNLVNAERGKAGLGELTVDLKAKAAAQVRAVEIKTSFSHTRPNGSSWSTALAEQNASYRGAGENIAYGQTSPQSVMTAWMNSPGHRANILNKSFTKIGVGCYQDNAGRLYWSQMFIY